MRSPFTSNASLSAAASWAKITLIRWYLKTTSLFHSYAKAKARELLRCTSAHSIPLPLFVTTDILRYEEVLAKRSRILGDDHPDTFVSLDNLALLLFRMGAYDRALPLYEQRLVKRRGILGDDHPDTMQSLNSLALLFSRQGAYDRALPLYEECLAKRRSLLGDDHPDTMQSLSNLAVLFHNNGEFQRALPLFEQCLSKCLRILGDSHPHTKGIQRSRDLCAKKLSGGE